MSEANVQLARRGYAAIAAGDVDAVTALLAPDVKWHGGDPEAEGACRNRDQALHFMRTRAAGRMGELIDVIDAGESVVVVMQPPSEHGQTPPLRANVTTFEDGRVVEMIAFETPEAALAHARASSGPVADRGEV